MTIEQTAQQRRPRRLGHQQLRDGNGDGNGVATTAASAPPQGALTVLDSRVMRGPNRWSRLPVVRLLVDLGALEEQPSNRIDGFADNLLVLLPGLATHGCSYGKPGGFVRRLRSGTWLGHVAEHVAIELQNVIGHPVTRGKTRSAGPVGQYDLVFAYRVPSVGLEAGTTAIALVNRLVDGHVPQSWLDEAIDRLRDLSDRDDLGPSTRSIADAAVARDIPVERIGDGNLIRLGQGVHARRVRATMTDGTSPIGTDLASDKNATNEMLDAAGLPIPAWRIVRSAEAAAAAAERLGDDIVIKPVDGNHGRGITMRPAKDGIPAAWERAYAASRDGRVIVQRIARGRDYRLLVVGGKLIAAAERVPAHVVGDGTSTVRQLIDHANGDPRRGDGHGRALTRLRLDAAAEIALREQGLIPDAVPAAGQTVNLARTANISTGGTAIDRTDDVHPSNRRAAELAAQLVGLDIAGIDLVCEDITRPAAETGGGIVEVNAAPGFRMHEHPSEGSPRAVGAAVVDMLFPNGSNGRIPIVAVTGTNGKTTTVRMIATALRHAGRSVGSTTTDAIVVNGWPMKAGDMAGPGSARIVLGIPEVDTAVLEVARGGIVREGLGYDRNDVAVVTNVGGDHLGLGGIRTIEQLAGVKQVPVTAVPRSGTAVLNADDRLVARMQKACRGRVIFFSIAEPGSVGRNLIGDHIAGGGRAVTFDDVDGAPSLVLRERGRVTALVAVANLPATYGGRALFNVANAAAAAGAVWAMGLEPAAIAKGLAAFSPSLADAPGRANVTEVEGRTVVLDYAHNVAGLREFGKFVEALDDGTRRRLAVVSSPGDRRLRDVVAIGELTGGLFDEVVVADPNPRGHAAGEMASVLLRAALRVENGRLQAGEIVPDEVAASRAIFERSRPGDLVVLCVAHAEPVVGALGLDPAPRPAS